MTCVVSILARVLKLIMFDCSAAARILRNIIETYSVCNSREEWSFKVTF